jgi:outer membrane protein assembly factor BamB
MSLLSRVFLRSGRRSFAASYLVIVLGLASVANSAAQNWPNWRGPNYDGSSDATNLPTKFSPTENIAWVADLPGTGASSPIVWEDAVFVTSADEAEGGVLGLKIDRATGDIAWSRKLGDGVRKDDKSTFAGPSAVTDGEQVIFFTGNGHLVAYDFDGAELWRRDIQKDYGVFAFGWTFSTSPVLHGGKVYLQVLQRDEAVDGRGFTDRVNESYLLALDAENGEELWQVDRPTPALMESREAFSTPVIATHDGRSELLVVGGDFLTGHDLETGKELWRWGTWNKGHSEKFWRLVPSPVYGDGVILACAPKKQPVFAVAAGAEGRVSFEDVLWASGDSKEVSADVPTPLYYQGRFYILNEGRKTLSCVEPKTGRIIWSEALDAKVKLEASPTGADGKIYLMSHLGEVFVVKAGDEFELLHQTQLGEAQSVNIRASIAAAQGQLFIRTDRKLFCIGK